MFHGKEPLMTPEEFRQSLLDQGIAVTDLQLEQFDQYYQLLVATNEHVNLTAITDRSEVYLKHFYDSILGAIAQPKLQTEAWSLCDIGAGAGFPSLPLKIMFPQLKVTIVDSLNKRINFLRDLCDQLGLDGVELVHDRAETFGAQNSPYREQFDLVTARAVARLVVLSELCLPAAKVGGQFMAYKATAAQDELKLAQGAINKLGGQLDTVETLELPTEPVEERNFVLITKVGATPNKYPRRPGVPNKKPLVNVK